MLTSTGVSDFVKKFRLNREEKLTQWELADLLGYSGQYISNVERGVHERPIVFCTKLSQYLTKKEAAYLDDLLSEDVLSQTAAKIAAHKPKRKTILRKRA